MKYPQWALKHKRKGTELRFIRGTYYLYEVTSKWNPQKKRAQKITGRLLGKITPKGFIESPKYTLSKKAEIKTVVVKEYGATHLLFQLMPEINTSVQKLFPFHYREILIVSAMRLLYQCPIKNMDFHFRSSYLSEIYLKVSISDKKVSSLLRTIGGLRGDIVKFFRSRIVGVGRNDYMLIDVTHLLSYSKEMDIVKYGYNSAGEFAPQVNLLFIYSRSMKVPVYYRIVGGNIREVKAFSLTLKDSGIRDVVLIADKGFYSDRNVQQLKEEGLKFIIPLKRSSNLIDYTAREEAGKKGFKGYFKYNKRYIWYYCYSIEEGEVHIYLDEELKTREERDYLNRIETHPEGYNMEGFYERANRFGTVALLTNMQGVNSEEVYIGYKSRNDIEVMIDAMKNILQADSSYMRDKRALEGWMFITFIALQWYYSVYKMLSERGLLSKYSPRDLLMHLTEIKKVKINDSWHTAEITKKTQRLLQLLNIPIT